MSNKYSDMPSPSWGQSGLSFLYKFHSTGPKDAEDGDVKLMAAGFIKLKVTQQMQIPLSYADAVIGTAGSNISYIRRASGSTVTIQETRGVPGEMTVEINGTASQVQTAQQLIQNFMAEAGAQSQTQTGGSTDQGYNSYAAHGSVYGSSPSNIGYTGLTGGYGASQTGGYGAGQAGSYNASQTGGYDSVQTGGYDSGQSGGYGSVYGTNYGY